jgi:FkbM family methyltransferase
VASFESSFVTIWREILSFGKFCEFKGNNAVRINASYSQFNEDVMIATALATFSKPFSHFFVDVGANNGQSWSNSRLFGEAGWKLLLIEPLPKFAQDCREFYADNENAMVVESAISASRGDVSFYVTDEPDRDLLQMGSSLSLEGVPFGLKSKEITVRTEPLLDVLTRFSVPNRYGVLSVDAEGHDLDVLETADFATFRPAVVCVEMIYGDENYRMIDSSLCKNGYGYLTSSPANAVYIDKTG